MTKQVFMQLVSGILISSFVFTSPTSKAQDQIQNDRLKGDIAEIWAVQQYESLGPGDKSAIAVHFRLKTGWHFY